MQCASSIAISAGFRSRISACRSGLLSCSGVMKRNSARPLRISSSASACCAGVSSELIRTARSSGRSRSLSEAIWSCCRASSGEITTVGPGIRLAGIW